MPLIDGTDLANLLKMGPLPPVRAVRIVEQVGRALAVAHQAGLVHRDVKPSNILICPADNDHTYLIDFGITKALDGTRLSLSGVVVGTPAYMAPECFLGEGEPRSDVYSLGCVLYEALTGQPPFSAPHPFAFAHLHQHVEPPRPSAVNPDAPAALDVVVARALAKSPQDRYPTATDLATASRAALVHQPAAPSYHAEPYREPVRPPTLVEYEYEHEHESGRRAAAPTGLEIAMRSVFSRIGPGLARVRAFHHPGKVTALAATEVGDRPVVVTGARDGFVRTWDMLGGTPVGQPFRGHTAEISAVTAAMVGDNTVGLSCGGDRTVRRWNLTTGESLGQLHNGDYAQSALSALSTTEMDGHAVAVTGGFDGALRIWDLATGAPLGGPLVGHAGPVRTVVTTRVGGHPIAVSGGDDGTVGFWNLTDGAELGRVAIAVRYVAVEQFDGVAVAVFVSGKSVYLWDSPTTSNWARRSGLETQREPSPPPDSTRPSLLWPASAQPSRCGISSATRNSAGCRCQAAGNAWPPSPLPSSAAGRSS